MIPKLKTTNPKPKKQKYNITHPCALPQRKPHLEPGQTPEAKTLRFHSDRIVDCVRESTIEQVIRVRVCAMEPCFPDFLSAVRLLDLYIIIYYYFIFVISWRVGSLQ